MNDFRVLLSQEAFCFQAFRHSSRYCWLPNSGGRGTGWFLRQQQLGILRKFHWKRSAALMVLRLAQHALAGWVLNGYDMRTDRGLLPYSWCLDILFYFIIFFKLFSQQRRNQDQSDRWAPPAPPEDIIPPPLASNQWECWTPPSLFIAIPASPLLSSSFFSFFLPLSPLSFFHSSSSLFLLPLETLFFHILIYEEEQE